MVLVDAVLVGDGHVVRGQRGVGAPATPGCSSGPDLIVPLEDEADRLIIQSVRMGVVSVVQVLQDKVLSSELNFDDGACGIHCNCRGNHLIIANHNRSVLTELDEVVDLDCLISSTQRKLNLQISLKVKRNTV